jgi:transcriptional regulator with XRE-family HTH domain
MDRIDEALADLRSQEAPNISKTAEKYGVERSRLSRYWNGISKKKDLAYENQRLLTIAQSNALISYINELTERGLPPTNAMVRNFAATIAGRMSGDYWITR